MLDKITAHQKFRPLDGLKTKYVAYIVSVLGAIYLFAMLMLMLIGLSEDSFSVVTDAIIVVTIIFVILFLLSYFPTVWYFNSIVYEIVEDEVHVFRGIVTKTRKIVPYRTITNFDIKQGPYDRLLNLGTIEIQTAGNSAQKMGPEERLDGLPGDMVEKIQDILVNKVRKVRGSAATSHDVDEDDILAGILHEVRELRKYLQSKDKSN